MKGEKVTISGADLIEGWKREADGSWSAPLAAEPKKVLHDGKLWNEFSYDKAAWRIVVKAGGDPRLYLIEMVVREQGIDLTGRKGVKVEDIAVVDTLKQCAPPAARAARRRRCAAQRHRDADPARLTSSAYPSNQRPSWYHRRLACLTLANNRPDKRQACQAPRDRQ